MNNHDRSHMISTLNKIQDVITILSVIGGIIIVLSFAFEIIK